MPNTVKHFNIFIYITAMSILHTNLFSLPMLYQSFCVDPWCPYSTSTNFTVHATNFIFHTVNSFYSVHTVAQNLSSVIYSNQSARSV